MKWMTMVLATAFTLSSTVFAGQEEDKVLVVNVQDTLKGGILYQDFDAVSVDAKDGKVTLKGVVPTLKQKNDVAERVMKVDGVTEIDNQIEVAKVEKISLVDLNSRINDALKGGIFGKSYDAITFTVDENGVVLLKGVVLSFDEKSDVQKRVQKVEGVTKVDNQIQVQPKS